MATITEPAPQIQPPPTGAQRTPGGGASASAAATEASLRATAERLAGVVDVIATCIDAGPFEAAAMTLCNELATRLRCSRVSVGVRQRDSLRLVAMSHSAQVDARSNLAGDLRLAMLEATDQARAIVHPAAGPTRDIASAQRTLAKRERSVSVLTVPLAENGEVTGALTLQRDRGAPFDSADVMTLEAMVALLGPLLELRRRDERSALRHILDAGARHAAAIAGPRHAGRKLLALAAAALIAGMSLISSTYRVTAPARLEGSVQRAVVAPLDGYVATAHARAGDRVEAGELIAHLDDRELLLERSRWSGELEQLRTRYRGAFAAHDRAEGALINARIERAEAQVALLDAQIERLQLRAPIDGVIIDGDLSQLLGSPVARGDVLFEVAPLAGYRVVIDVDERDVRAVERGQVGQLVLEGLAGIKLPIVVEQTTPVSVPADGRNAFRTEARVNNGSVELRPGMAGYVKIDAGERTLLWIWTHRIREWVGLKLWAWWP